jgi:hypothetical protein
MKTPKQRDLFGPVPPVPEPVPVEIAEHDFPMSEAYVPRGLESVPEWLLFWIDEPEWPLTGGGK